MGAESVKNTENVRVGVVGCGYWGRNLVRNFHKLGALAGVCDVDARNLDEMRHTYPVFATNDFEAMLAMPDLQAVVISTPAVEHYRLAKQAMLRGKDVFVEKPLALRLEDGEELVKVARKHARILMVGHLLH